MTSSHANTRRRSARLAFDEEENGVPVKKPRTDEALHRTEKRSDARVNGDYARKNKKSKWRRHETASNTNGQLMDSAVLRGSQADVEVEYDDGDGDFQFSRRGSRKTQQMPVAIPQPVPEEKELEPTKPKPKVKKMLPLTPTPAEKRPKRRSARLSGDKEQVQEEQPKSPIDKSRSKDKDKEKSKLPPDTSKDSEKPKLSVDKSRDREKPKPTIERSKDKEEPNPPIEKDLVEGKSTRDDDGSPVVNGTSPLQIGKRGDVTKIALPFADTPINKRNKELRKGHRRSSTGIRGRRASSLMDSGTSNAVPHAEVETSEFYKLISQDLPEPRRMKQLLTWCGTRALPSKPSGIVEGSNAIMAARVIQEELLKEFSSRSELSDWFNREDTAPAVLVKKPNPRNIQNAAKLKELEEEIEKFQLEKSTWEDMLESTSKLPPSATTPPPQPESKDPSPKPVHASPSSSSTTLPPIDAALLSPSQASILSALTAATTTSSSSVHAAPSSSSSVDTIQTRLRALASSLEFQVDQFADGIHRLEQYRRHGDDVVDGVLTAAATKLEEREEAVRRRAGTKGVEVRDVLRSLSRVVDRSRE